jgi:hypothetical protein
VLWYMPVISAILEAEAGGSRVWGQPGLQSKNLTQKKKKNIYIYIYTPTFMYICQIYMLNSSTISKRR